MPRNVEVKAKIGNWDGLLKVVRELCSREEAQVLHQHDTFFCASNGRLKLREFVASNELASQKSELIFYNRPDVKDAKISDFLKVDVQEASLLKQILNMPVKLVIYPVLSDNTKSADTLMKRGDSGLHLGTKLERIAEIVDEALGTKGEIKKERHLFIYGQTRIHVDKVEGLGNFVELEVCLNDGQDLKAGELIAYDLLQKLGVPMSDLLSGAYIDALTGSNK